MHLTELEQCYYISCEGVVMRLARMLFITLNSESWSEQAYALVTASRPALVSDKIYKCEQVYSSI